MLCLHPDTMAKRLRQQVFISGKTYKDLVQNLHEGKKSFGRSINFYMAAARELVGQPILMIMPQHTSGKKDPGPKYLFEKKYAFDEDAYFSESEIKLRFIFNGIDHYTPFFQKDIAALIRIGAPLLKSVKQNYSEIKALQEKIPQQSSINVGMKLLAMHMKASTDIANKMSFNAGWSAISEKYADTISNIEPLSNVNPLIVGNVRRRKSDIPSEVPTKKPKDILSMADHLAEMDSDITLPIPALTHMTSADVTEEGEGADSSVQTSTQPSGADSSTSTQRADDLSVNVTQSLTSASGISSSQVSPRKPTDCKPNQCICGIEFDKFENLQLHKGAVHSKNTFTCSGYFRKGQEMKRCDFCTRDEGTMWRHYRTIHLGLYYHYCDQVGCTYGWRKNRYGNDSLTSVKKHKQDVHKIDGALKCPICGYVASEKYKLKRHTKHCENKDKSVKWLKCEDCPKEFRDHDTFQRHKRQDHPLIPGDKSAWYHCHLCTKIFRTYGGRKKHIAKHLEEEENRNKKNNK